MRIDGNGRITEMAENINSENSINTYRKGITKETALVKELGYSGEMTKKSEEVMKTYLCCFNIEELSKVPDMCEKTMKELRRQSEISMDETYHKNKASLDDFLEYEQ